MLTDSIVLPFDSTHHILEESKINFILKFSLILINLADLQDDVTIFEIMNKIVLIIGKNGKWINERFCSRIGMDERKIWLMKFVYYLTYYQGQIRCTLLKQDIEMFHSFLQFVLWHCMQKSPYRFKSWKGIYPQYYDVLILQNNLVW